eukprot:CAMPEP_0197571226 /NCGR_PEP_ID=MMETSP1320-20131121/41847_1 /TAXON_ID=91990 /ORGANISM="Bolidomonas sp., Strain RCC2347" /LENGTH=182 /DNA_ID=CAMNT_0043133711 /DNA_START=167 /DNA_END=715 /DNA_ORIENTATION=+
MSSSAIAHGCVFFYGDKKGQHACLSQFYPATFMEVTEGGVEEVFYCAEQYMMAGKARCMGDEATRALIMACCDPRGCKRLGRNVSNWDEARWVACRSRIVERGNYLKFVQNEELRRVLVATGDLTLVEAAPQDRIWGIGLSVKKAVKKSEGWRGLNLLGKALEVVRTALKSGEEVPEVDYGD